ncbi:MAG: hypothetical protein U0625_05515 [Phycisphaerales bacterium]
MQCCTACAYQLDGLPGVPAADFAPFENDSACPECGFRIPRGARLLTGSSSADALQPISDTRRWMIILASLLPFIALMRPSVEAVMAVAEGTISWRNALGLAGIPILIGVLYFAMKRWSASDTVAGRRENEIEHRWLVAPGILVAVTTPMGRRWVKHYPMRDFRRFEATVAEAKGLREGATAAKVVSLVAYAYRRDGEGRRNDIHGLAEIHVRSEELDPPAIVAALTATLLDTSVPAPQIVFPGESGDSTGFLPDRISAPDAREGAAPPPQRPVAVQIDGDEVRVNGSPWIPENPQQRAQVRGRRVMLSMALGIGLAVATLATVFAALKAPRWMPDAGPALRALTVSSIATVLYGLCAWAFTVLIVDAVRRRSLRRADATWIAQPGELAVVHEWPSAGENPSARIKHIAAARIGDIVVGRDPAQPLALEVVGPAPEQRVLVQLQPENPAGFDPHAARRELLRALGVTPR